MAEHESPFDKEYTEDGFWEKVKSAANSAGKDVIEKGLVGYYALQNPTVPPWAKATLIGALGYFVFPFDAIPDITPVVGYSDDLGVLTLALGTVAIHITDAVKEQAAAKLKQWFGN